MCPHCKRPGCRVEVVLNDGFRTCAVAIANVCGPLSVRAIGELLGLQRGAEDALENACRAFRRRALALGYQELATGTRAAA